MDYPMIFAGANMMGVVMLCLMYYYNSKNLRSEKLTDKILFKYLQLSVIFFIVFDTAMVLLDKTGFSSAPFLNMSASVLYFVINPFPALFWLLYCDYRIYGDAEGLVKRTQLYIIPAVIHTVLVLTTPVTGLLFRIDGSDSYRRSETVWISWIFTFGYVIGSYLLLGVKTKRKKLLPPKKKDMYFYLFQLPPVILAVVQIKFNGSLLVGLGMVISVFMIFANVQNKRLYIDELLGIYNRKYMETNLDRVFKTAQKGASPFVLMINIDDLKAINLKYGHSAGDGAIIETAEILEKKFKEKASVARYSGGEFVVFGKCAAASDVREMIASIDSELNRLNSSEHRIFKISLSIGGCAAENGETAENVLQSASDEMEQVKRRKREDIERIEEYRRLLTEVTNGLYENIYEFDITRNRAGNKNTEEYLCKLGIPAETPFDKALRLIAKKQVKEEFRQGYIDAFSPKKILREYSAGTDSIKYDFPVTKNGENYYWMRITARVFIWEYDNSVRMLIYSQNIDEEKRRELEPIERLENELAQNRIAIMLSQIQPHFLYNSLVVIKQLCDIDPKIAKETVVEFADYLRGNLDSLSIKDPIPFERELKHVETYLALEKKRFGDKLNIIYDIKTSEFMLPALSLQPIVENAVRYGVTKLETGGSVIIRTQETAEYTAISVIDNGIGFDPMRANSDGRSHIGIENVRSRLNSMCGGALEIISAPGKGTTAIIKIPKEGINL